MEFKRDSKTVIIKGILFFVAITGASVALYMQEDGWEWRNTLIWSVGVPFSLSIFLAVLKTNAYLGETVIEYQRLFCSKVMRYENISSIELITATSTTAEPNTRSSYFVLRDKYGKKMTINRAIILSQAESYRFLEHIRTKNPTVSFDYGCLAILGDHNPRMDFKEAVVYVLDEYKKRQDGG